MSDSKKSGEMPPPAKTRAAKAAAKENLEKLTMGGKDDGSGSGEKATTPAVLKTKKLRSTMAFNSPSDAIQSPFSQKLNHPKHHAGFLNDKPPQPNFSAGGMRPKRLQDLAKSDK